MMSCDVISCWFTSCYPDFFFQMYNEIIAALEQAAKDESKFAVFTGKTHLNQTGFCSSCRTETFLIQELKTI